MNVIDKLINRLHGIFKKDPDVVKVVQFTHVDPSLQIEIKYPAFNAYSTDGQYDSTTDISADGSTLQDLVDEMNAAPETGYTASLVNAAYGPLLLRGIVEKEKYMASDDGGIYYPSNLFYQEMQVYGWEQHSQWEHINEATDQMYLHSSTGDWLDYWGAEYLNITRYDGETDDAYSQRIIYELIRPNQNNYALENIVKDAFGLDCTIVDAEPNKAELDPVDQSRAPGHFILDLSVPNELSAAEQAALIENIKKTVRTYKAGGTDFFDGAFTKLETHIEAQEVTESLLVDITVTLLEQLLEGPIYYGVGWVYGLPNLLYGNNAAIKEQIIVKTLNASDDSVVSQEYLGG